VVRVRAEAGVVDSLALERGELGDHLDDVRRLPHFFYTSR
jgi:hypothetical protein